MSAWDQSGAILLGRGTPSPGVAIVLPDGRTESLIDLHEGQSVYALDVSPGGTTLAAGTRNGLIAVVSASDEDQPFEEKPPFFTLLQGVPILSVCWIDEDHFAASDTAGRVLLWDLNNTRNPRRLKTNQGVVVSLLTVPGCPLAGICADGRLLIWDRPDGDPTCDRRQPPPPSIYSLIKAFCDADRQTIYYPGRGGALVEFTLGGGQQIRQAHQDDFYALIPGEEFFFTAGRSDGRLKVWRPGKRKCEMEFATPLGVIDASLVSLDPLEIVLITDDGKANLHRLGATELEEVGLVEGGGYRQVFNLQQPRDNEAIGRRLAGSLAARIELTHASADDSSTTKLHRQLVDLGYEHVGLKLKIDQALSAEDYLEALRFSRLLVELLPNKDPRIAPDLVRHISLLNRFWMVKEAGNMLSRLAEIDPSAYVAALALAPADGNDRRLIIESDIDLVQIIQAYEIITQPFSGNFVFKKQRPLRCDGLKITATEIASYFNQIVDSNQMIELPRAASEETAWISVNGSGEAEIVLFEDDQPDDGYQLCLFLSGSNDQTIITPIILFRWTADENRAESNQSAIALLTGSAGPGRTTDQLDSIYKAALDTVRRMVTRAGSKRGINR